MDVNSSVVTLAVRKDFSQPGSILAGVELLLHQLPGGSGKFYSKRWVRQHRLNTVSQKFRMPFGYEPARFPVANHFTNASHIGRDAWCPERHGFQEDGRQTIAVTG